MIWTPAEASNLGSPHVGQGLVFEDTVENSGCREADEVETLPQQLRIAAI